MKDGRFEKGDHVMYKGKEYYFVSYDGKMKAGDGPWQEMCHICPLTKKGTPDQRVLNARWGRFRYRAVVDYISIV